MSGISLKNKPKGVDICAGPPLNDILPTYYIIRSDLGCYMRTDNIYKGENLTIYSLQPSCQDGDHYVSCGYSFYIIKGNSCREVSNLDKYSDSRVFELHPNCRGGDHYLCTDRCFYIIFQSRGVFRITDNLETDYKGVEMQLPSKCRGGLYYWGICFDKTYTIKQTDQWGVQILSCALDEGPYFFDIHESHIRYLTIISKYAPCSVHPDVLNFLPGGLAVTRGPAFGRWELIKMIDNDSDTPITWEKEITRKVGYNKSTSSSMERNWKVSGSLTCETEGLFKLITKAQFSLSAEYGGLSVNTESQSWEEATEVKEKVGFTLKPKTKMYVWQHKFGFGKEDVLFCRGLKFTNDPKPPTDSPL